MNNPKSAVGILERHYGVSCRECGAPLPRHHRIYCSSKCRKRGANRDYEARIRHPKVFICTVCGEEITNNRTKYCSDACRRKHDTENQRVLRIARRALTRDCIICGAPFILTTMTKLTCSPACTKIDRHNKRQAYKQLIRHNQFPLNTPQNKIRKCLKCDEPFPSTGNYICPRCTIENDYICKGSDVGFYNRMGARI